MKKHLIHFLRQYAANPRIKNAFFYHQVIEILENPKITIPENDWSNVRKLFTIIFRGSKEQFQKFHSHYRKKSF